jgi:hypothetical protein
MLVATGVCIATAVSVTIWRELTDPLRFNKRFHRAIRSADRIVVWGPHINADRFMEDRKVCFEISDPDELAEVSEHIQLAPAESGAAGMCFCSGGYPAVDWYRGQNRIAETSLQHGTALRWDGFPGAVAFTDDSAKWLASWFGRHDFDTAEFLPWLPKNAVEKRARKTLRPLVPANLREAIRQAESGDIPGSEEGKEAAYKTVRASFRDTAAMYSTLFQILGCLAMRWDCWYEPEQSVAFEFLTRAPRGELDAAIRLAAQSKIAAERRGAARMVFSQYFMTDYGKTDRDISKWMTLLADTAYADSLPENRRLVLARLAEYRGARAFGVLELAVADPDQTVRRQAIQLLAIDKSPKAILLLDRVASGRIPPRVSNASSIDFGGGTSNGLRSREMAEQSFDDTDCEAAEKVLRKTRR